MGEKLYIKYTNNVRYGEIVAHFRERSLAKNLGVMEIEWDEKFSTFSKTPNSVRAGNLRRHLRDSGKDDDLILFATGEKGHYTYFLAYRWWYDNEQLEFDKSVAVQPDVAKPSINERLETLESKVDRLFDLYINRHAEIETAFKYALDALRCLEPEEGEQK